MAADNLTIWALIIGGGGIAASIASLWRVPSDKNKVVVDTAQGAVVVQKGVIDSLVAENDRLRKICNEKESIIGDKDRVIASLEHIFTVIDDRHEQAKTGARPDRRRKPPHQESE